MKVNNNFICTHAHIERTFTVSLKNTGLLYCVFMCTLNSPFSTLSVSKLEKEVQSGISPGIKEVYFNKGL